MQDEPRIAGSKSYLLRELLREVSRTFYLTLRILPGKVRSQIGLAYLLARASDTIADTDLIPGDRRLSALREFRERLVNPSCTPLRLPEIAQAQTLPAEKVLLRRIDEAFEIFDSCGEGDRRLIRKVLLTIVGGQELDLIRFGAAKAEQRITALATAGELDDYTYRVAGCVGEFWTEMCQAHLFDPALVPPEFSIENGIRFGRGLQLINILRDVPRDLREGRCYFPADELAAAGLGAADLLLPETESRFRPIYDRWLRRAMEHLKAGWAYTTAIPFGAVRLRLACAWPILIGQATLGRLREGSVLDPGYRIKISRADVRQMMVRSVLWYPWPAKWKSLGNQKLKTN